MVLSLKEELRRTFELASLRQEAKHLRTPRQWGLAKDLMLRAAEIRAREEDAFRTRYQTRVEVARRRLIDQAAMPARTLSPSWAATDRFSPDALLRQAQRDVRDAHDRRVARINRVESHALSGIVRQASRENDMQGQAQSAFTRVADPGPAMELRKQTGPTRD